MAGKCNACGEEVKDRAEALQHALKCEKVPKQIKKRLLRAIQRDVERAKRCEVCQRPIEIGTLRCSECMKTPKDMPVEHFLAAMKVQLHQPR